MYRKSIRTKRLEAKRKRRAEALAKARSKRWPKKPDAEAPTQNPTVDPRPTGKGEKQ